MDEVCALALDTVFDPPSTHNLLAHDFCGRRCAGLFNENGKRPSKSRRSPTPDEVVCTIPGCRKSVYVDADGNKSKFCSNRHRACVPVLDGQKGGLAEFVGH